MLGPDRSFTLRRSMTLMAILCVIMAVVSRALNYWGPREFTTLAVTILVATNILAWFQSARWQVFWVGFGLFGWAYLSISLASSTAEYLPTTPLIDGFHDQWYGPATVPEAFEDSEAPFTGPTHRHRFMAAGHAAISLFFALLGGIGARLLFPPKGLDSGESPPPDGSLLKPG
ncbi:hypothetical protein ACYOEI_15710 [Singulisphaera rosea]